MTQDPPLRVIPVWIRGLAGVVAAAAALAIILLVHGVPGQDVGLVAFIRLAAQALLYLAVSVLFGYVAATGLPPAHLWRHAGHSWWPAAPELALTPDLHRFLERLRARHPQLRECWALESAGQGEWWFLAVAEPAVLDAVRGDWDIRRKDVRLYLRDDSAQSVAPAWGRAVATGFATWDWEPQSEAVAEFRCPLTAEIRLAQRIWG